MSKLFRAVYLSAIMGTALSQLFACSSTTIEPDPSVLESLLADSLFSPVADIPSVADIFYLPPEVVTDVKRSYDKYTFSHNNAMLANEWLASYINASQTNSAKIDFRYQDNLTQIARETYAQRAGNCMSLVVMTSALADILNVGAEYQDIAIEPVWDKQGDFYLINGHVNLRLLPPENLHSVYVSSSAILVDFMPERALRGYGKTRVNKQTLISMFYNNMAAESLVNGDLDRAYALIKAGLNVGQFVPSLNTLAIIYRHKGDEKRAEQVYRYALKFEAKNLTTLYNLALILGDQGRLDEWAEINKVLELARIHNPYYYYDMAQQAFDEHQYDEALAWYQRALAKADYRHEFFFGLSKTYWALGDEKRAKLNMEKALALSRDDSERHRYQNKLQVMLHH